MRSGESYWRRALLALSAAALFSIPASSLCGTIQETIHSTTEVLPSGGIAVRYELANTGDEPIQNLTAATFLAMEADQSGDLGEQSPGRKTLYNCELNTASLKPGNYILVTRVDFEDVNGMPHRSYQFTPINYKTDHVREVSGSVAVELSEPRFNLKSLLQSDGSCRMSLRNKLGIPVRTFATFYLPVGFTTRRPEQIHDLAPGEEKEVEVPLRINDTPAGVYRFNVVVRTEAGGTHESQRIEKGIWVEEKPVYFRMFLILAGLGLAAGSGAFFWRRRI